MTELTEPMDERLEEESESSEAALDNWALPNDEDSEELADEIGVSGIYDAYGREVLKNVFENRLRLAPNSVKLIYGVLKNEILSYGGFTRRYEGREERFYVGEGIVFVFAVNGRRLELTVDGAKTELGAEFGFDAVNRALNLINKKAKQLKLTRNEAYVPVKYAERYPFNPDAVLRDEDTEPVEGEFDGEEYYPIEDELSGRELKRLLEPEEKAEPEYGEDVMQTVSSAASAAALSEPIVYFYNAARTNENEIGYVSVQQVLNDKFLGKMLPQQFFAVAEGSDRIITLNLMSVKRAAEECDSNPTRTYVTQTSARLLAPPSVLKRLIKAAQTENGNLMLAFDSALLEALGEKGEAAVRELAQSGVGIMIDNTENAGLKVLTEYPIDCLRFDGRYYKEDDVKKTAHLETVLSYAKVQGIKTAAIYVDTVKQCRYFLERGVENIEGDVVGSPVRIADNAVRQAKKLPTK